MMKDLAIPKQQDRRVPHVSRSLRDVGFHDPIPQRLDFLQCSAPEITNLTRTVKPYIMKRQP